MNRRNIATLGGIILLGLVAWGVWALREKKPTPVPPPETQASASPEGLGAELYGLVEDAAPKAGYIPQTNPFTEVETNPLRGVSTNPFAR